MSAKFLSHASVGRKKRSGYKPHLDPMDPDRFRKNLRTKRFGRPFYYFREVTSTNDVAAELIHQGAPEGTLVVAERQTQGRGRRGRKWNTAEGKALAFSLILKPRMEGDQISGLTLAAAVAVAKTLEGYGLTPQIKWPNDVLLKRKKVCGILTEMGPRYGKMRSVILGIGINLHQSTKDFPGEIRKLATSVYRSSGLRIQRIVFLQKLMKELETVYGWMKQKPFQQILDQWSQRSITLGQRVRVHQGFRAIEGQVAGIDLHGFLLLQRENGKIETVFSGDVQIISKRYS